jgi:large subunit ribosomal protein L13e
MVKHNNRLVKNHFRKDWQRHVKTWFQQPARKLKRKLKRQQRAVKIFPRPTEHLRPLVHCPTLRYNTKIRLGRGFTLDELKLAKIPANQAKSIGISIDYRRKNRCLETQRTNVQRLQLYKSKVLVFPRRKVVKFHPKKAEEGKIVKLVPKSTLKLFPLGSEQDEEKAQQLNTQFPYEFPTHLEGPRAITDKERTDSAYLTLRKARGQAARVGEKIRKARQESLGMAQVKAAGAAGDKKKGKEKGGKEKAAVKEKEEEGGDDDGGETKGKGKGKK